MLKKILLVLAALLVVMLGVLVVAVLSLRNPLPEEHSPEGADALAQKITDALQLDAWDDVGVIHFSFAGRPAILWDKKRGFARVGDVLLDLRANPVEEAVVKARTDFLNDSFWLNPFGNLHDEGVELSVVDVDDGHGPGALRVHYTQGGDTPGDTYLWFVSEGGVPNAWRMWTSLVPIQGLEVGWADWVELHGGTRVSTSHAAFGTTVKLAILASAGDIREMKMEDPFTALAAARGEVPSSQPASQPADAVLSDP